jgi:DNA polymerase-3 subunit beta
MIITIEKDILQKALSTAESVISSKNVNTILSTCLVKVMENELVVLSTDNEIAVRTRISSVNKGTGSFTVNAKKFSGILKEFPSEELNLNINDQYVIRIEGTSGKVKGHYELVGMGEEDFPEIPEFQLDNAMEIEQPVLRDIIRKISYAASHDTIKPIFNGIHFHTEKGNLLVAVATDSRRLSLIYRGLESVIDMQEGIIIPLKTVNEIAKLLDARGSCLLSVKENQCFIRIDDTEVISRLVDGQFPNYRQVIPKEYVISAEVETKRFIETLRRLLVVTREPANKIIMNFAGNRLNIEAHTPEVGIGEEELPLVSNSEEEISIGVNAVFMIDALKEIDSEFVRCTITGQMSPITLRPMDDDNQTAVVMPIQIKS